MACKNHTDQMRNMLNSGFLHKPLIRYYDREAFPDFYKESFNAILKIGKQKNTTKSLYELMNVFVVPLY